MSQQPDTAASVCPDCGAARRRSAAERCWMCGHLLPAADEAGDVTLRWTARPVEGVPRPPARFTFGIASVLLLITLISVILGLAQFAPGLAILLLVAAVPAFVRTAVAASQHRLQGSPLSMSEKLNWFMMSLGIVTVIGMAAGGAFAAVCFAGFWGTFGLAQMTGQRSTEEASLGIGLMFGGLTGLLAAGFIGYVVGKRIWKARP